MEEVLGQALDQCDQFRQQEGENLRPQLAESAIQIGKVLKKVDQYETERIEIIKNRLSQQLKELSTNGLDEERFQQEIFYYVEKLDINEEKVRLSSHLKYFNESLDQSDPVGKRLGFICQEIGREINTIGSKANHAGIQKLVVQMKEELEKIKEQTQNIL